MIAGLVWVVSTLTLSVAAAVVFTHPLRRTRRARDRADAVAAERAARFATPAIETRPGHNREALAACNAIWNADQLRKEKP